MMELLLLIVFLLAGSVLPLSIADAAEPFEVDVIKTTACDLAITFVGHGSLMLAFNGKTIHVDPDSRQADYPKLPKADLILLTHEHKDHCDPKAVEAVLTEKTVIIANGTCAKEVKKGDIMRNGEEKTVGGLKIQAVPAYNLVHMRSEGVPYHPKGSGNGYVVTFGDKKVYIAGDTENIPEMRDLKDIDIAFLPMNLPFTMTPEMTAEAAKSFNPKILYPYHFGETDTSIIEQLLKGSNIEVRIRKMGPGALLKGN
ncbi:MAG: MBL fold metallo-hydrolase [Syntrophobacteraceae bacterium]